MITQMTENVRAVLIKRGDEIAAAALAGRLWQANVDPPIRR
jgi:hypothetical protein